MRWPFGFPFRVWFLTLLSFISLAVFLAVRISQVKPPGVPEQTKMEDGKTDTLWAVSAPERVNMLGNRDAEESNPVRRSIREVRPLEVAGRPLGEEHPQEYVEAPRREEREEFTAQDRKGDEVKEETGLKEDKTEQWMREEMEQVVKDMIVEKALVAMSLIEEMRVEEKLDEAIRFLKRIDEEANPADMEEAIRMLEERKAEGFKVDERLLSSLKEAARKLEPIAMDIKRLGEYLVDLKNGGRW